MAKFSGDIFQRIVQSRAANEEAEFQGFARTEMERVRTFVAANPNLSFDKYEKQIKKAAANIQAAAGKTTTRLARGANERWLDKNLGAATQRMLTDAEAELSKHEFRRAEAQRKAYIADLDVEGLINHSDKMVAAGTYDRETENARLEFDISAIEGEMKKQQKELLWNVATQQATDEQGLVNWAEVLSFLNQPKNTQGVSSGDVDSLIENAETQLRIQTAKTDPEVYWSVLRRISNDPESVPEEELGFLVNKGKLTTDDYKEFMRVKETKGHPLKSARAQIYFGELDALFKEGAIGSLEQYDVKNEKLTDFFESKPDVSSKEAAEFFEELTGQEKTDWVWKLLNYYTVGFRYSTAGLGYRLGKRLYEEGRERPVGETEPILFTDKEGQEWQYIGDDRWRKK